MPAALDGRRGHLPGRGDGVEAFGFDDARIATLPRLKAATGPIADAFFDRPSARARASWPCTGTNGKTSTAWWMAQALTLLGRRCGVIGTLGIGEPPLPGARRRIESTGLTTPDPVLLHAALRRFVDAGFAACAIEASSIGIVEHRLAGAQHRAWRCSPTSRGPPRLPRHDGRLLGGQARAVRLARACAPRWSTSTTRKGAALAAELQRRHARRVDLLDAGAPARLRAASLGYDDGGLAFELHEGDASAAGAQHADRRLQRAATCWR